MKKLLVIILVFTLVACSTPTVTVVPNEIPKPSATFTSVPTLTATPAPSATPTLAPTLTLAPSATPTLSVPVLVTRDAQAFQRKIQVPIIMYHYIEPVAPDNKDQLRAELTVVPQKFEEQLSFLKARGYTTIDLYQWYGALTWGAPLPPKPVVITFDDGYGDLHEYAFPLMEKYGFTGTIFIITDFTDAARTDYITWAKALEMARAGWRLESHTKMHPSLQGQTLEFQRDQARGSMNALQKQLGYTPRFLAYPYGKYDQNSIKALQEVGYWGAVTTNIGREHTFFNVYAAPRIRVNGSNTLKDFASSLGEKP